MEAVMKTSLRALNIALFAVGCSGFVTSALAESRYYDPSNVGGNTTGYDLYKTIGCPGKGLLDPGCTAPVAAKPAPAPVMEAKPAPAPKPEPKKPEVSVNNMPNAKPGECYAKVIKPPVYRTEQVKKLVKEAGERIEIVPPVYKAVKVHVTTEETQEVVPAVYDKVMERVIVKPATTRLEVVPAVYENVEEKVMVKPATKKAIDVPAVFEDVTERKLVRDAYTYWKPGTTTNIQKIDEKSGEIMCLVEVPAEYQTVTNRVLKTPASVRYEEIPAEYQTITKAVLKSPATTRTVEVPAEYADREVTKLVKAATTESKVVPVDYMREVMTEVTPATEKRVPVPAEYATVDEQVLVSSGNEHWSQILCDVNATQTNVMEIQKALMAAGFNPGPIDGNLGSETMTAVVAYQKAKGLPEDGYLTMETVKALGISPK
jgi:murein L,D-transpeptidase YcbB/YkuD